MNPDVQCSKMAKTWRPAIEDWIKKMWHIYTMEYLAIRKVELLQFVTTWINLEMIMLSEISQSEKTKNHMISFICGL